MIGSSLQPYIYSLNIFILCMSALGLLRMFITFWFANVYDYQFIKYRYAHHRRIKRFSPSISVIVPAFNEEKAIIQTLASICRSTYKKISIVVVDDGSSDNTAILVKEFIEVHPDNDIKLIQQPNSGKSVAINNALFNYDNSVLTMVLDADSLLKEDAIEKMVKWFLNPKIVALAMNVKMLTLPTFIGACQRFEFISAYRGKCAEHVLKTLYIIGGIGSTFRTDKLKKIKETIKDEINCRNHKKHDRLAATSDPGKYRTRRYARRQSRDWRRTCAESKCHFQRITANVRGSF